MASEQTKESQTTSTTKVGVASNAEVDVIVTKNATVSKSDNEEVIKEVVKTLTPMVTEFVTNAVKVVGQTVSEIVEFVWNQWKEMGKLEKILLAIAAALIVTAVGTAVGCGAWHVIRGNWETIRKTTASAMKALGENSAELLKQLNSNVVMKKLQAPFEKKSETNSVKIDDVKNLVKSGHGKVIMSLLAALPLFVIGIHKLGELEDETKVVLKKDEKTTSKNDEEKK